MEKKEREISFGLLWKVLKNSILWMVIVAVGLGVLAGVYTKISSTTTYTAKTEYLISSGKDTPSKIRSDLVGIINLDDTTEAILKDAGIQYETKETLKAIHGMVHAYEVGDNARIAVSVTGTSADTVVQIAQAYEKYLPMYITEQAYASRNTTLIVVDECETSLSPNSIGLVKNVAIAAVIGFVLAYIVFFVIEMINNKVRGVATLKDYFASVAILGKIPTPDGKKVTGKTAELPASAWLSESSPAIAEATRGLRASVAHLLSQENASKIVGITATSSNDGSAAVAINLAQSYAQLGKKVLLIEADMRTPTVKELLGLDAKFGLAEVLSRAVPAEKAVASHISGIDVLVSLDTVASPAEILAGAELGNAMNTLTRGYDLVLVLLPAMGEVSDACVVASHVGGYITVVRVEKTDVNVLQQVVEEMARLNMNHLGFVVTDDISKN